MIFLALKHLWQRKRQTFITLSGIFLGSAAFVIISGFFLGFQNFLIDQLVSGDAHIKISKSDDKLDPKQVEEFLFSEEKLKSQTSSSFQEQSQEQSQARNALAKSENKITLISWIKKPNTRPDSTEIKSYWSWLEKINANKEVVAVSPQYSTTALLSKAGLSQSISIIGTEPKEQIKITNISSKITKGDFSDLAKGSDRLVMGATLANDLGLDIDDVASVTASTGQIFPMKVVGIYETGNPHADRSTAYTSIGTAQKIGGQNGKVNQISIRVKDFSQAGAIANEWKKSAREKVESWDQANSGMLSVFAVQDAMRFIVIFVILLVAGFGIYNVLSMVVLQKRKDIAILRSIGFDQNDILRLFLLQGVTLGTIGSFVGAFFGYLVCLYLQTINFTPPHSAKPTFLHIAFSVDIYFSAFLLGIGAACIAAYLPARAASRLTPIEIIREGAE